MHTDLGTQLKAGGLVATNASVDLRRAGGEKSASPSPIRDAFDPPLGTAGTLGTAATSLGTVASELTKDIATAKHAVATATSNWRGTRTQEFEDGILGPQLELAQTMAAVEEVNTVVGALATALGTATSKVAGPTLSGRPSRRRRTPTRATRSTTSSPGSRARASSTTPATPRRTTTTAGRIAGEIDAQTNRLVPGGSSLSPDATARKVAESTGVDGIDSQHPSAADAWKVLHAGARHAQALEALTGGGDNTGEKGGGPFSGLPTDVTALAAMRDAMIADGVTGTGLQAVVQQYWVAHAAQSAGIDLDQWDPSFDAQGNASVIPAVYTYYGELYLKDPTLRWAGLANIVGPIFAAGFDDLSMIHQITDKLSDLPSALKDALPDDIKNVLAAGGQLTSSEVKFFEDTFLAMQKHIFMDIGSQHEAYATGGINAIQQMADVGAIPSTMLSA